MSDDTTPPPPSQPSTPSTSGSIFYQKQTKRIRKSLTKERRQQLEREKTNKEEDPLRREKDEQEKKQAEQRERWRLSKRKSRANSKRSVMSTIDDDTSGGTPGGLPPAPHGVAAAAASSGASATYPNGGSNQFAMAGSNGTAPPNNNQFSTVSRHPPTPDRPYGFAAAAAAAPMAGGFGTPNFQHCNETIMMSGGSGRKGTIHPSPLQSYRPHGGGSGGGYSNPYHYTMSPSQNHFAPMMPPAAAGGYGSSAVGGYGPSGGGFVPPAASPAQALELLRLQKEISDNQVRVERAKTTAVALTGEKEIAVQQEETRRKEKQEEEETRRQGGQARKLFFLKGVGSGDEDDDMEDTEDATDGATASDRDLAAASMLKLAGSSTVNTPAGHGTSTTVGAMGMSGTASTLASQLGTKTNGGLAMNGGQDENYSPNGKRKIVAKSTPSSSKPFKKRSFQTTDLEKDDSMDSDDLSVSELLSGNPRAQTILFNASPPKKKAVKKSAAASTSSSKKPKPRRTQQAKDPEAYKKTRVQFANHSTGGRITRSSARK